MDPRGGGPPSVYMCLRQGEFHTPTPNPPLYVAKKRNFWAFRWTKPFLIIEIFLGWVTVFVSYFVGRSGGGFVYRKLSILPPRSGGIFGFVLKPLEVPAFPNINIRSSILQFISFSVSIVWIIWTLIEMGFTSRILQPARWFMYIIC